MKSIQDIIQPYYKQNKGGLEEWVDYEDVLEVMKLAQLEVIREIEENIGYYAEKHGEGADADVEHFNDLKKQIMNDGK